MTEEALIAQLQSEVRDVKACFTEFSFQSSALATVAAGFMLSQLKDGYIVVLAAVPTIFVLMVVCRVAIFKYTTANRNLGYELHLDRLAAYERIGDENVSERVARVKQIGWEEALRAWRVVWTNEMINRRRRNIPFHWTYDGGLYQSQTSKPGRFRPRLGEVLRRRLELSGERRQHDTYIARLWSARIGSERIWRILSAQRQRQPKRANRRYRKRWRSPERAYGQSKVHHDSALRKHGAWRSTRAQSEVS
jgi:hypothetical protein